MYFDEGKIQGGKSYVWWSHHEMCTFESYHIINATIQYICRNIITWNYMSITIVYREDPNKVLAVEEDTK